MHLPSSSHAGSPSMPSAAWETRHAGGGNSAASPTGSTTTTAARPAGAPPASYMRLSRISCDPCRKRKLRCDRVMPCATCVRRGIADQCYQETSQDQQQHQHPQQQQSPAQMERRSHHGMHHRQRSSSAYSPYGGETRPAKRQHHAADMSFDASFDESGAGGFASEEAHLENLLLRAQRQLNAMAGVARDSSLSLDAALQALQSKQNLDSTTNTNTTDSIRGSGPDGYILWRDVAPHLPPIEECEELLRFYFEDLAIYIQINQRSQIDRDMYDLVEGSGLSPGRTSVLCTILAIADGTAPPNARIRKHSIAEHDRWVKLMGDPLVTPFGLQVDNSFERVMTLGLLAIYNLYMGRHDRLWECMGAAVRKGYIIGLFDERHKSWRNLSLLDVEYRRRLAWYMLSLERLQAFMRQLPFALHQDYVHMALPSFESDGLVAQGQIAEPRIMPTYPTTLPDGRLQTHMTANDGRTVKFVLIELSAVCHEFLANFSSMSPAQRYHRAGQLDDVLERTLIDGLEDSGIDLRDLRYTRFLSAQALATCRPEKQLGVNLFVSSIFFFRCIITRRFLTDENAPHDLRFVSLTYAQGIVSTVPSLTRMVKDARIPIQMTWNANHLLCAATAFAVVILGHDPYAVGGIDADPVRGTSLSSRRNSIFPQEQVQWLADNIFSTLECLEILVERGNAAAVVAKNLLERLCGSQDELRGLYRKRFSSWRDNEVFRTPSVLLRDSAPLPMSSSSSSHAGGAGNGNGNGPWARSPAPSLQSHPTPPSSTGAPTPGPSQPMHVYHAPSSSSSSSSSQLPPRFLPPIQPYPPTLSRPPQHQNATATAAVAAAAAAATATGNSNPPILGRFTNASSLLDAVLMDPSDLSFLGQSHTIDLVDTLAQESAAACAPLPMATAAS